MISVHKSDKSLLLETSEDSEAVIEKECSEAFFDGCDLDKKIETKPVTPKHKLGCKNNAFARGVSLKV